MYPLERFNNNYSVCENGHVYGIHGKILGSKSSCGYIQVGLYKNGKINTLLAHRLVWEGCVGPIPEGMQINHKDGDRTNNKIINLEVCTAKENINHSWEELGRISHRRKSVIDTETGVVYDSAIIASKETGINYSTIRAYLNGQKTNKTNLKYI
jgi:hypothetical protein